MSGDTFTSDGVTINAETVNIGGDVVGRDRMDLTQAAPAQPQPVEPAPVFRLLVIVSRPLDVNELPAIADQWRLVQGLQTVNAPVAVKVLRPPTLDGLRTELLAGYDVIHFDDHGDYGHICPKCGRYVSSDEDELFTHCPNCDPANSAGQVRPQADDTCACAALGAVQVSNPSACQRRLLRRYATRNDELHSHLVIFPARWYNLAAAPS